MARATGIKPHVIGRLLYLWAIATSASIIYTWKIETVYEKTLIYSGILTEWNNLSLVRLICQQLSSPMARCNVVLTWTGVLHSPQKPVHTEACPSPEPTSYLCTVETLCAILLLCPSSSCHIDTPIALSSLLCYYRSNHHKWMWIKWQLDQHLVSLGQNFYIESENFVSYSLRAFGPIWPYSYKSVCVLHRHKLMY